uniref:Uncharacterized protein n=1 Tax=Peronospora matthiolae TaxID=2874970 RepID=A0AAV1V130_9STRA
MDSTETLSLVELMRGVRELTSILLKYTQTDLHVRATAVVESYVRHVRKMQVIRLKLPLTISMLERSGWISGVLHSISSSRATGFGRRSSTDHEEWHVYPRETRVLLSSETVLRSMEWVIGFRSRH